MAQTVMGLARVAKTSGLLTANCCQAYDFLALQRHPLWRRWGGGDLRRAEDERRLADSGRGGVRLP